MLPQMTESNSEQGVSAVLRSCFYKEWKRDLSNTYEEDILLVVQVRVDKKVGRFIGYAAAKAIACKSKKLVIIGIIRKTSQ